MLDWINYLLGYQTTKTNETGKINENKKIASLVISPKDLQSVVLKKHTIPISEKKIKRPAFARNAPVGSFHLLKLTDYQLKEILNVKLKSVKTNDRKTKWCSRHPVLKELQEKIPIKF